MVEPWECSVTATTTKDPALAHDRFNLALQSRAPLDVNLTQAMIQGVLEMQKLLTLVEEGGGSEQLVLHRYAFINQVELPVRLQTFAGLGAAALPSRRKPSADPSLPQKRNTLSQKGSNLLNKLQAVRCLWTLFTSTAL